jgi:CBS domain-containing protein
MKKSLIDLSTEDAVMVTKPDKANIKLDWSSPAISIMTDFTRIEPVKISEEETADIALEKMKRNHVRSLLVVDDKNELKGIITSRILLETYTLSYMAKLNIKDRADVTVKDLMIKKNDMHAIEATVLKDKGFTVKDVVETLCDIHERHMLVVEYDEDMPVIVGVISAADIARDLKINVDLTIEKLSFANLTKHMNF